MRGHGHELFECERFGDTCETCRRWHRSWSKRDRKRSQQEAGMDLYTSRHLLGDKEKLKKMGVVIHKGGKP